MTWACCITLADFPTQVPSPCIDIIQLRKNLFEKQQFECFAGFVLSDGLSHGYTRGGCLYDWKRYGMNLKFVAKYNRNRFRKNKKIHRIKSDHG